MGRGWIAWAAGLFLLCLLFTYEGKVEDSWNAWNLPLSGVVIVLDAGHGGIDGGAVGQNGVIEKEVTLSIARKLRDFLQQAGALVLMTREEDKDLAGAGTKGTARRKTEDLKERVRFVNESMADFLISIHLNAIPSPRWYGAQTFYSPGRKESEKMAYFIQAEIRDKLGNTTRVPKKVDDIFLLRSIKVPAVLVEVGFLSHPREARLLASDGYQTKMANAIYQGILRYCTEEEIPRLD
ncbi:N-acetylmuramoyl-L-alanine amidase CwlD [Bacillaceae bacterium]